MVCIGGGTKQEGFYVKQSNVLVEGIIQCILSSYVVWVSLRTCISIVVNLQMQ